MSRYSFSSVIFDLDGVVTKTALVHAKAWKATFDEYLYLRENRDGEPFREFTHEDDYLPYVDGKPRYKGVKSFLASRGINIPFGDPCDLPGKETVCGIGNKKNFMFQEILKKQGVEVYPSSIEFIKLLKENGIRVGVASSSKNCQLVLQSAGIEELFETRVDGVVSVQLGLKGKPEGDIFTTAAHNLSALPRRSVVVEDAESGVQAGRNGGFGLVLGIARENNESGLFTNCADIVIHDIADIDIDKLEAWFHRKPKLLFKNWSEVKTPQDVKPVGNAIMVNPCYARSGRKAIFSKKRLVLFLDYDGALTPIVDRPELAVLARETRDTLRNLAGKYTIAIVSGRMREDVESLVNIKGLFYAGSHGFDISGPGISMVHNKAEEVIPVIYKVAGELKKSLGDIPGVLIEEKKFSVAVHYRLVNEDYLSRIKDMVGDLIKDNPSLRLMNGKKVFELLPDIDWDKGKAIRWIMDTLKIPWSDVSVVYIGDDETDEDAFIAVRTRGTGILVSDKQKESASDFRVSSTDEVKKIFKSFI